MALKLVDIEIIRDLIKDVPKPVKVLSLGYPDIMATASELSDLLKVGIEDRPLFFALEVFDILSAELIVIDQNNSFGENLDLNFPLKLDHYGKYSLVLDPGTLEHIFNIGTGLENIVNALQVGGFVFHINPINMYNHGYWNLSPITYKEFYEENGFEIVRLEGRRKKGTSFDIPATARFRECPENSMIVCVARKIKRMPFMSWPIQGKYTNV